MSSDCGFVHSLYDGSLRQLKGGVFTPGFADSEVGKFIHDIFNTQSGAEDYAKRFSQHQYFKFHISRALREVSAPVVEDAVILDVGSGSGNTVFPCLDLFSKARIVATDLSIPLLEIMVRADRSGRVCAVQQNAEDVKFRDGSFDYVVGGAILHHLFRPDRAIWGAVRVLKPGGMALFFEPCQNGQVLLKFAYERLLLDRRSEEFDERVRAALKRQVHFIGLRLANRADEKPEMFAKLEDKWLFSKSYLTEVSKRSGAGQVWMLAMDASERLVEQKIRSQFRLLRMDAPDWVWSVTKELDNSLPLDFKLENPTGVALILRK
jgi:ubiquinone/menaquinone biosynthesis C-methylase UbiE